MKSCEQRKTVNYRRKFFSRFNGRNVLKRKEYGFDQCSLSQQDGE